LISVLLFKSSSEFDLFKTCNKFAKGLCPVCRGYFPPWIESSIILHSCETFIVYASPVRNFNVAGVNDNLFPALKEIKEELLLCNN
jgi:hypothetical protein